MAARQRSEPPQGSEIRKIAINTGGGDAPGLNAVIRAATLAAINRGWEIYGIRDGFNGLLMPEQFVEGGLMRLTRDAVRGITANREKAEGWLSRNAIIVTALNPVIGYAQGAALVKEALARNISIRELIMEKTRAGSLKHRDDTRPVTMDEIEEVLGNLRALTEGGIGQGMASGG